MEPDEPSFEDAWRADRRITGQGPARKLTIKLLVGLGIDPITNHAKRRYAQAGESDTTAVSAIYMPETLRAEVEANLRRIIPACTVRMYSGKRLDNDTLRFSITAELPSTYPMDPS